VPLPPELGGGDGRVERLPRDYPREPQRRRHRWAVERPVNSPVREQARAARLGWLESNGKRRGDGGGETGKRGAEDGTLYIAGAETDGAAGWAVGSAAQRTARIKHRGRVG
jgi:hypothetical protein